MPSNTVSVPSRRPGSRPATGCSLHSGGPVRRLQVAARKRRQAIHPRTDAYSGPHKMPYTRRCIRVSRQTRESTTGIELQAASRTSQQPPSHERFCFLEWAANTTDPTPPHEEIGGAGAVSRRIDHSGLRPEGVGGPWPPTHSLPQYGVVGGGEAAPTTPVWGSGGVASTTRRWSA